MHIIVVGVGGVGTNVGLSFVHFKKVIKEDNIEVPLDSITIIDPDLVEEKNLNRLPFKKYIGMLKVHAFEYYVRENIDSDIPIVCYPDLAQKALPMAMDELTFMSEPECTDGKKRVLVIDCTDSVQAQSYIFAQCQSMTQQTDVHFWYTRIGNENNSIHIESSRTTADSGWGEGQTGYISTQTNQFYINAVCHYFHQVLRIVMVRPERTYTKTNCRVDANILHVEMDMGGKLAETRLERKESGGEADAAAA